MLIKLKLSSLFLFILIPSYFLLTTALFSLSLTCFLLSYLCVVQPCPWGVHKTSLSLPEHVPGTTQLRNTNTFSLRSLPMAAFQPSAWGRNQPTAPSLAVWAERNGQCGSKYISVKKASTSDYFYCKNLFTFISLFMTTTGVFSTRTMWTC